LSGFYGLSSIQQKITLKGKPIVFTLFILTVILVLSGCSDEEKIKSLESKIATLESRLEYLAKDEDDEAAFVSTEENSYATVKTEHGAFIVVCKEATPYLDGYKVKLAIGNITSASFSGAEITATWGAMNPVERFLDEHKKEQKKTFNLTTIFPPGQYSDIEIVLTPAKPEEIKKIKVSLLFNSISLRK